MGPFTLERAKRLARRVSGQTYPKIAPIMWEGKEVYLLIVSDEQLRDFRATNRFNSGMYYSEVRGKDNPLFSGAEFMWDGVVVYCWEKILKKTQAEYFENGDAVNTGVEVHRALFLGANAITLAWGKNRLRWSEEDYWHGDGWSAGIEAIYGMAKTEFNGYDFGVITVDTAAASDA
jgi:N4-gp56 family major capsid protein